MPIFTLRRRYRLWGTNTTTDKTLDDIQQEIWNITDWTKTKRIEFEPTITEALACHRDPRTRREMKAITLYLNRDNTEPIKWKQHARFLGVTFSYTGNFHQHFKMAIKKCHSRIKAIWIFKGKVPGDTMYRVYKTAIEPILLYGTEVMYKILSQTS